MSRLIDTAPERIFLCVSDDLADINRPFPEVYPEDEPITWATNWTVAASVCYVRADLHDEAITVLRARAGRAEADLVAARALLRSYPGDSAGLHLLGWEQRRRAMLDALAGRDKP